MAICTNYTLSNLTALTTKLVKQPSELLFSSLQQLPKENCLKWYIKHEIPRLTAIPNTEKTVKNTARSGVFLTVIGSVIKYFLEWTVR